MNTCHAFLHHLKDFSRTQRENIICQTGFVKKVYEKMQAVMNMYEDGAIKDQKLNKKHLIAVLEFKQHLLQPLHNLKPSFQSATLQRIIDREISLKEMKANFIHLKVCKAQFLRHVQVDSCSCFSKP